jgi:zinc transport system ATP-binding protein
MLSSVASGTPPALEFEGVSFTYGRVPILHQVSLSVHEGEFVAVVGANGSGKTTLMKLGLGLLRATEGRVWLFGSDVATFSAWGKVGYVPQRAVTTSAGKRGRGGAQRLGRALPAVPPEGPRGAPTP